MSQVSLEEAKDELAIELEFSGHDARVLRLIKAAEKWAENFLNRTLEGLDDNSPPDSPFTIPEDLKQALLLHISANFDKDPQTMNLYLETAIALAYPYRLEIGV